MADYPDDADGHVLAELEAHGIDMTRPITFEFAFNVADEATANVVSDALVRAGYETETYFDDGELDEDEDFDPEDEEEFGPSWTVYAKVSLVPNYDELMQIQERLKAIAEPEGGDLDGWEVQVG